MTVMLVGIVPALALSPEPPATGDVRLPLTSAIPAPASLEPQALRAAAASGALAVELGEVQATLVLARNDLVAPDALLLMDGQPADPTVADVDLFTGRVVGDAASHARLAFTDTWAEGYVYTQGEMYDLRTVDGTVAFVATAELGPEYAIIDQEAPMGPDAATDKQGLTGCLGLTPEVAANPAGFVIGWGPTLFYDIIVDADRAFYQQSPGDWAARQLSHMNRVDGYYVDNFDLKVRIVGQSIDSVGTVYTSTASGNLLQQARSEWAANPASRDTVQVLSGVEFDGATVGQANCIGGAHSKQLHYTVTQTLGFSEFAASKITAHELGHMMSAHHHYANCHDPLPGISSMPCTVMSPDVGLIHNGMVFSMLSRNTVRGYAEDVL